VGWGGGGARPSGVCVCGRAQAFLSVAENVVVVHYPASAKQYLSAFPGMGALAGAKCRNGEYVFSEQQVRCARGIAFPDR
jgi:hypothetical protein